MAVPLFGSDTTSVRYRNPDTAAIALGLLPLNRDSTTRIQEIRIWRVVEIGVPHDLLRLVRQDGRVTGQYGLWWRIWEPQDWNGERTIPVHELLRYRLEGTCSKPRTVDLTEGCEQFLLHQPNWGAMWDSLTALGVWTLPDQSTLPRYSMWTSDGYTMTVEVRDGSRYRSYSYANPQGRSHPSQRAAAAIHAIDRKTDVTGPRPLRERAVEGKLELTSGLVAFTRCGSAVTWGATGQFSPAIDSAMGRVRRDSTARETFRVRMRGMLAYPGLAKLWRSPFAEVFEVDSVLTVADWAVKPC